MQTTIWTIGHSTRTTDELIRCLKSYGIQTLVDVRTVPRSRTNPQFNREELERNLPAEGIEYIHMKELGGLRKPDKDSINTGWHNEGFRGYADYMQTPRFDAALALLMDLAQNRRTALMCAEVLPWRCHRSLLGDALVVHGLDVIDIFNEQKSEPHKLTRFAVVDGEKITYPFDAASSVG